MVTLFNQIGVLFQLLFYAYAFIIAPAFDWFADRCQVCAIYLIFQAYENAKPQREESGLISVHKLLGIMPTIGRCGLTSQVVYINQIRLISESQPLL